MFTYENQRFTYLDKKVASFIRFRLKEGVSYTCTTDDGKKVRTMFQMVTLRFSSALVSCLVVGGPMYAWKMFWVPDAIPDEKGSRILRKR